MAFPAPFCPSCWRVASNTTAITVLKFVGLVGKAARGALKRLQLLQDEDERCTSMSAAGIAHES